MLSIKFGYGRPAALARALAADFFLEVSSLGFFFGSGVSHTSLAISNPTFLMIYRPSRRHSLRKRIYPLSIVQQILIAQGYP